MTTLRIATLGAVALAAGLAGCSTYDTGPGTYPASSPAYGTYSPNTVQPYQAPAGYVEYGRVTNVSMISGTGPARANNPNSTAGTVLGAVVGGALGNQIGSGGGRAAATILGAFGGAMVGNSLANRNNQPYNTAGPVYRVWVQTDQGAQRTYDVTATGDLRPGDRVRIENGVIYLA